MANQEQLDILRQGVDVWNKWRNENSEVTIDLSEAHLEFNDLNGVDFRKANLRSSHFNHSEIIGAAFNNSNLDGTDFSSAKLIGTNFLRASFKSAELRYADFSDAIFSGVDFSAAKLFGAKFIAAWLKESNFQNAVTNGTVFANVDLSESTGLESVRHYGASTLGMDTIKLSKGKIPVEFLRGCGLSDWEIEAAKLNNPDLTDKERDDILYKIHDIQVKQPIQISPLFISYSHADGDFVDKMEKLLNEKGIRFWRDIRDMKAGRIEKQIDRAIRQNPTVLLVLSENSVQSDWVEHEVRLARKLEKDTDRDVLCPIALDDSWESSPWPERIMEKVMEYNILEFSDWEDDQKFKKMFVKLIDGLNLYYQK